MSAIWINSGRLIDPMKIEDYEFSIAELAHPICIMPRYSGQTWAPYTVGEHTVHLSKIVPPELRRAALLHDMNEGLTNDLPNPFKAALPDFAAMERRVQRHIFNLFDEPWENMEALEPFDRGICVDEMAQVFAYPYRKEGKPFGVTVRFWPWDITMIHLRNELHKEGFVL